MIPSVVVLTHNSASTIKKCLSSVSFSDDLVVIDSHSTDATLRLAHHFTPKTYSRALNGDWAAQRNFALSHVKHPWVLFLDSDEVVSSSLRRLILSLPDDPPVNGYFISRLDYFLGRPIRHGEMGHSRPLRLGKRLSGTWRRPVHEVWDLPRPLGFLSSPILHYRKLSLTDFFTRLNTYTSLDTAALIHERKFFTYFDLLVKPIGKFLYYYIYLLGFLDGFPGLISAYHMSLHSLITRVKLWEAKFAA